MLSHNVRALRFDASVCRKPTAQESVDEEDIFLELKYVIYLNGKHLFRSFCSALRRHDF